jgi:hypothetical protein
LMTKEPMSMLARLVNQQSLLYPNVRRDWKVSVLCLHISRHRHLLSDWL